MVVGDESNFLILPFQRLSLPLLLNALQFGETE